MKAESLQVVINGLSLEIEAACRRTSGELVLFIHGLGCSKESFQHSFSHPGLEGFSLLAPDLPGFGGSSRPGGFSYSMEDHARACDEVLKAFDFDRLHVVAHSMGGAVGLLLPEELLPASFVNVEGNLVSEDCGLVSREAVGVPFESFEKGFFPELKERFKKEEGRYLAMGSSDPLAFYKSSESLVSWSEGGGLLDRFKAMTCRKYYFHGERNASMPVLERLKDVEKVSIKGSGHFPMIDNPEAFYAALADVIQGSSL